jgi:hypothetical protein
MNTLKAFFTSPLFGFLLKLLSGFAAAGFGLFGIGAETRDKKGKLTKSGKIALVGIVVSGVIAAATSIYEFNTGQEKDRQERVQTQKLMLSVQRNLYPLRGAKIHIYIDLGRVNLKSVREYREFLAEAVPHGSCFEQHKFSCKFEEYEIKQGSPLFPKSDSVMGKFISNITLEFDMYKKTEDKLGQTFKDVGAFYASWPNALPEKTSITYSYNLQTYGVMFDDVTTSGQPGGDADVGSAYSLADFIPGLIAAEVAVSDNGLCKSMGLPEDPCRTNEIIPLIQQMYADEVTLTFPYPKGINFNSHDAIKCDNKIRRFLVFLVPNDIDSTNMFYPDQRVKTSAVDESAACEPFKDKVY